MGYGDDNQIDDKSDESSSLERTLFFPVGREAGKVLASYPFRILRDPDYNFFQPFKGAIDYKLARFFFAAYVPKTRIDEFFQDGFLTRTDANRSREFSYRSAHTLYKKIDEMSSDPLWRNGFVDFRLAKNTEFWYRDLMLVLKYLLWRKSFASHMIWAPL